METIVEDIKVAKPTWFASVPRVFEKFTQSHERAEAKGGLALKIFRWACSVGNKVSDYQLSKSDSGLDQLQYQLATNWFFTKFRTRSAVRALVHQRRGAAQPGYRQFSMAPAF
jgi:long-chain acyl-CoA synthetase